MSATTQLQVTPSSTALVYVLLVLPGNLGIVERGLLTRRVPGERFNP